MRKVMYHVDNSDDFDKDEVMTYEEVALFSPRSGAPRPLVLIGASGVGRNEIKRRQVFRYLPFEGEKGRKKEKKGKKSPKDHSVLII